MNQMTQKTDVRKNWKQFGIVAILFTIFFAIASTTGMLPMLADELPEVGLELGALETIISYVITIITTASLYIGIIIVLWGFYNVIMALRREDSDAIGKQVTTIVVGAVLIALRFIVPPLYSQLIAG